MSDTRERCEEGDVQCDACMLYVAKDKAIKKCDCGAYLCPECEAKGEQYVCFCDC